MNDATLQGFRDLAAAMQGNEPQNARAKDYAARFGGTAKKQ